MHFIRFLIKYIHCICSDMICRCHIKNSCYQFPYTSVYNFWTAKTVETTEEIYKKSIWCTHSRTEHKRCKTWWHSCQEQAQYIKEIASTTEFTPAFYQLIHVIICCYKLLFSLKFWIFKWLHEKYALNTLIVRVKN